MVQLEWKIALVTGSSRGIGRGIVHKLVDAGIERVAVNYFANDAAAHETAEMLKGKGAEVLLIKADCTDSDQVRGMFDQVKSEFGSLDIFVHNARPNPGTEPWFASAMEMTPAGLDAAYRSQVHAMVIGCQACAPLMPNGIATASIHRRYTPGSPQTVTLRRGVGPSRLTGLRPWSGSA